MSVDQDIFAMGGLFADRYELKQLLGEGGMGKVFLVEDKLLNNEVVALKVLHRELCGDERHVKRFMREMQLTRKLSHPNIIRSFDMGVWEGLVYFTMEYVRGHTLKERLENGVIPYTEMLPILSQIADALSAMHKEEIIHRDLKPANILLCEDGTVRIMDFGVARPSTSDLTAHNEVVGSSAYMAPESWTGKDLTPAADLYSLGVTVYECLCGYVPFDGDSAAEAMGRHCHANVYPLRELVDGLPLWIDKLVSSLLNKDPLRRPKNAAEVVEIVEENYRRRRDNQGAGGAKTVDDAYLASLKEREAKITQERNAPHPEAQAFQGQNGVVEHEGAGNSVRVRSDDAVAATFTSANLEEAVVKPGQINKAQVFKGRLGERNIENFLRTGQPRRTFGFIDTDLRLRFVRRLGVIAVSFILQFILLAIVVGPMGSFVHDLWGNFAGYDSLLMRLFVFPWPAIIYAIILATPILLISIPAESLLRSVQCIVKTVLVLCFVCLVMFGINYILIFRTSSSPVNSISLNQLQLIMQGAVKNMIQIGLLQPEGEAVVRLFGLNHWLFALAYYFCLLGYLGFLGYLMKRHVFSEDGNASVSATPAIFAMLIPLIACQFLFRDAISQYFKWYSLKPYSVPVGPFTIAVDEYSLTCAAINWSIVLAIVYVFLPLYSRISRI